MNLTLNNQSYCDLYEALNNLKDAIDDKYHTKASNMCDDLIEAVRYAEVV